MSPEVVRHRVLDTEPQRIADRATTVLAEMGATVKTLPGQAGHVVAEHGSLLVWGLDAKKEKKRVTVQVFPLGKRSLLDVRIDYSSTHVFNISTIIIAFLLASTLLVLSTMTLEKAHRLESLGEMEGYDRLIGLDTLGFILSGLVAITGVLAVIHTSKLYPPMAEFADEILRKICKE